jgi:hypothetical protein
MLLQLMLLMLKLALAKAAVCNGNTTTLNLAGQGLTVWPDLSLCTNLSSLDLRDNQLTALPAEISQLVNLTDFNVAGNMLTVLPAEIVLLAHLQTLDLSYNLLISFPAEIGQLVSLQTLKLGGNQLTTLLAEIGQLVNLQTLDMTSNQLTSLPPEIGQLVSLQNLYLSGSNQLTFVPPEIAQLTNLQELYISHSYKLTALPAEIGQLVHLRRFSVDGCPIICLPRVVWYRWGQYQGLYTMCRTANVEAYLTGRVSHKETCEGFGKADPPLSLLLFDIRQIILFLWFSIVSLQYQRNRGRLHKLRAHELQHDRDGGDRDHAQAVGPVLKESELRTRRPAGRHAGDRHVRAL